MPLTWMVPSLRSRRAPADRRARAQAHRRRFALEQFEDRTLLSTIIWDGGGNDGLWSTAANWSGDVAPGAGDDVVFNGTSSADAVVSTAATVKNITITSDYAGTIAVNASLTANGYFTQAGGDLTGAGPLKVARDFTNTGGTFNVGSVQFIGGFGVTVKAPSIEFNNVSVGFHGQAGLQTAAHMTVNGNLTLNSRIMAKNGGITVMGNVTSNVAYPSVVGTDGVITLAGGGNQTITGNNNGGSMPGLNFAKTGGSATITGTVSLFDGWDVNQPSNIPITTTGSTVRFGGPAVRTIDTGYASLNNVVLAIHGQAGVTVAKLKVGGDLTLNSVLTLDAPSGAITVAGNLTSTTTDVRGTADITMTGGDGKTITAAPGDFPNGGIIIAKGGNNVTANVTTPLDGLLKIDSVGAFGGSFAVGRDVAINTGSITSWSGGKLVFGGGANQTVTVSNGGRLPGVVIDKTGGTLTIPAAIDVVGNWKYNQGNINTAGTTVTFKGGDKSVDTTGNSGNMAFNNVVINVDSLNASNPVKTMVVGGTLTLTRAGAMGGVIEAKGNVDTSVTASLYSANGGKILFNGNGAQTLTATVDGARVPGVEINATGSVKLDPGNPISVTGSWKYVAGAVDTADSTVNFIGGDKSVDTGAAPNNMAFNNVVINADSLNASNPVKTIVVGGKLTLTRAGAIGGVIEALGDVDTGVTASLYSWGGGKILFTGDGVQVLTATEANGRVPGVEIDKTGGSLTLATTKPIGVTGNWKYVKGTVDAAASTVNFIGGDKTVDTGSSPKMTFGNVGIDIGGNSFNVPNARTLGVAGGLTINSVANINAPAGAITVVGDLTSNDGNVGGSANITMFGGNDAMITGGDFPNGGIVISKPSGSTGATVDANVTTPLDGPLTLQGAKALTGTFQVGRDVTTNLVSIGGNADGAPVLVFKGNQAQTINTSDTNNKMIPGIKVDKNGGSLAINNDLKVGGSWIVAETNTAPVNIAVGKTISFYEASETARTIDIGNTAGFQNVVMRPTNNSTVTIVDDMIVKGGLSFVNRNYTLTGGGSFVVSGDVDTSISAGLDGSSAVIRFVGEGNQTLKANSNFTRVPNIVIDKSGAGTLTIDNTPSRTIMVMGGWDYIGGNVDAAGSTIRFGGSGTTIIRPGDMKFGNVAFVGGDVNILGSGNSNDAGDLLYTGSISGTSKVKKGTWTHTS